MNPGTRHRHFTPAQVRMMVGRAERQLEQIAAAAAPAERSIGAAWRFIFDDAVVSLIRVFREHVEGASAVATQIAREYAHGVDQETRRATVACLRRIQHIVREARSRHLA
ncbi:hypothetical protein GCM10027321_41770 [Massilia terrae]|uniref:Uncharacterized protein n=1 Tax=Massilia terrae TaxID=1811224 RepID=A0ABT2CZD5_9BURK|nr:hypothetical protein [Massilia terrae]MCS0659334.1 hypothetical protein [Massilia terrae]